jgi:hypothetical protein
MVVSTSNKCSIPGFSAEASINSNNYGYPKWAGENELSFSSPLVVPAFTFSFPLTDDSCLQNCTQFCPPSSELGRGFDSCIRNCHLRCTFTFCSPCYWSDKSRRCTRLCTNQLGENIEHGYCSPGECFAFQR